MPAIAVLQSFVGSTRRRDDRSETLLCGEDKKFVIGEEKPRFFVADKSIFR